MVDLYITALALSVQDTYRTFPFKVTSLIQTSATNLQMRGVFDAVARGTLALTSFLFHLFPLFIDTLPCICPVKFRECEDV